MAGRALPPVLVVNFLGHLGVSLVLPFLVFVVRDLGGNALAYGLLGAIYPAAQMLGAPLLGRWSDRAGRRPVLMITQTGTVLSWTLFLVAMTLPAVELGRTPIGLLTVPLIGLFVARALDGFTGANIAVANAVVADVSDDLSRARNFGRIGMAGNLGFVIGPAMAGLLGGTALGAKLPVMATIAVAAVGLAMIVARLPETRAHSNEPDPESTLGLRAALRLPGARLLLPLYFVIFLAFNVFYTAMPVHAAEALAWSPARLGVFFATLSALMALVQGPLLARIAPRVPAAVLVAGGNVLLAAAFVCLTAGTEALTWTCAVLFALGNGLMWPSYLALLSTVGGPRFRGAIQGHGAGAGSAAAIVGLLLGGVLYDRSGAAAFWVPAAVILGAGLVSGRIAHERAPGTHARD